MKMKIVVITAAASTVLASAQSSRTADSTSNTSASVAFRGSGERQSGRLLSAGELGDFVTTNGNVSVGVFPWVCPNISGDQATWTAAVGNVQMALSGTVPPAPGIGPTNYHPVTSGQWQYLCVSASQPLWLGTNDPTGVQRGNRIAFSFDVTSSIPFAPTGVRVAVYSNDGTPPSIGFTNVPAAFSREYVGVSYGPDGVAGTADDVTYRTGSALVNRLSAVGPGVGYDAGSDQSGVAAIESYLAGVNASGTPFTLTCVVEVRDPAGNLLARKIRVLPFVPNAPILGLVPESGEQGVYFSVGGQPFELYAIRLYRALPCTPANMSAVQLNDRFPIESGTTYFLPFALSAFSAQFFLGTQ